MSYTKLYIGAETPLSVYKGDDVIGFTFTITNADGSAYDFTGYTDVYMRVYDYRGGTLLKTISSLTISSNIVTLNIDYSVDLALPDLGVYYYEVTYEDALSRPLTVSFGKLKII